MSAVPLSEPAIYLEDLEDALQRHEYEGDFKSFVIDAWHIVEPSTKLVWSWHLDVVCIYIEEYHHRNINRLIFNIPPGSMKSLLVSVFYPAWAWTTKTSRRFINLTNEIGLATRDNTRMRLVIESDWYQRYWADKVVMNPKQNEKMLFANLETGFRQGLGITGSITGKRGTDLLIDDPLDARQLRSMILTIARYRPDSMI